MPRGTMPKSGAAAAAGPAGFKWHWKAALNVLIGVGIAAFGIFEYVHIAHMEQEGEVHFTGRRRYFWSLLYKIGGKWAITGLFLLVALAMIGGGIMVMLGKKTYNEDE
jgi:hypothetical protein